MKAAGGQVDELILDTELDGFGMQCSLLLM